MRESDEDKVLFEVGISVDMVGKQNDAHFVADVKFKPAKNLTLEELDHLKEVPFEVTLAPTMLAPKMPGRAVVPNESGIIGENGELNIHLESPVFDDIEKAALDSILCTVIVHVNNTTYWIGDMTKQILLGL